MPLIRCTQRLLKSSRRSPTPNPSPPSGPFAEWYANAISLPFPGKWVVLYTHPASRLSLVVEGRSLNTTLPQLRDRFAALLRRMRVPEASVEEACSDLEGDYTIAKTASSSVIGTQTDFGRLLKNHADRVGSMDAFDLVHMENRMVQTPITALDIFPDYKVHEILGLEYKRVLS